MGHRSLPSTRQGALEALETLTRRRDEADQGDGGGRGPSPRGRPPSPLDKWREEFLASVEKKDDSAALSNSLDMLRRPGKQNWSSNMQFAATAFACKHFSLQKRFQVAREIITVLLHASGEAEEGPAHGGHKACARALGSLIQDLARDGRFLETLEVAHSLVLQATEGSAPSRQIISDKILQGMIIALKNLGDGDLLFNTWQALVHGNGDHREKRDAWVPSKGTYGLFLSACLQVDGEAAQRSHRGGGGSSLFSAGTYTQMALEIGANLDYTMSGHLATMLLDHCKTPTEVTRVMDMHSSSSMSGKPVVNDEGSLREGGTAPNFVNLYKDKGFPFMLKALQYVETVPLNSTLLTSLVKALFRSGCSGEGFAVLRKAYSGKTERLASGQHFNALVHYSTTLNSYWPMQRALEMTAEHWHAPSKRAIYSVLRAVTKSEPETDDPDIRSSVYNLLDPSNLQPGGYFLLDSLSYFAGDDLLSSDQRTSGGEERIDNSPENSGKEFFSNSQHIKQMLIWQVWERYLLPSANEKAVRQLVHCLHKVNANDGVILRYMMRILSGAKDKTALASEMVRAFLHEKVGRKDLVLDLVFELAQVGVRLDDKSLSQAVLALDSRERVKRPYAVQNLLRMAVKSGSLGEAFEENLILAVTQAVEGSSSGFGQDGMMKKSTEKLLKDLELWDTYYDLVQAKTPEHQVLERTCENALQLLRASRKTTVVDVLVDAVGKTEKPW